MLGRSTDYIGPEISRGKVIPMNDSTKLELSGFFSQRDQQFRVFIYKSLSVLLVFVFTRKLYDLDPLFIRLVWIFIFPLQIFLLLQYASWRIGVQCFSTENQDPIKENKQWLLI